MNKLPKKRKLPPYFQNQFGGGFGYEVTDLTFSTAAVLTWNSWVKLVDGENRSSALLNEMEPVQ